MLGVRWGRDMDLGRGGADRPSAPPLSHAEIAAARGRSLRQPIHGARTRLCPDRLAACSARPAGGLAAAAAAPAPEGGPPEERPPPMLWRDRLL